jgi:hypothetical protein
MTEARVRVTNHAEAQYLQVNKRQVGIKTYHVFSEFSILRKNEKKHLSSSEKLPPAPGSTRKKHVYYIPTPKRLD